MRTKLLNVATFKFGDIVINPNCDSLSTCGVAKKVKLSSFKLIAMHAIIWCDLVETGPICKHREAN